jgi:hypothetical protein
MSTDKLPQDATASTKGVIYQLCVAVQKCYEMVAGQKVLIERLGDVTIPDSHQVETKLYSDALTDNHPNLWTTLRNWVADEFGATGYAALILYTTQHFGEHATISQWNEATSQQRLEILGAIHRLSEERESKRQGNTAGLKLKTPDVLLHQRYVLDPGRRAKLLQVTERFLIEACSPTLPELHALIQQKYIKGILDGKKVDFLNVLIGFITKADESGGQNWEITYEEFEKKVGDLITLFCRETRVFPRKHFDRAQLPDFQQLEAHREHAFVQKIRDIEYHEVIPMAVKEYTGAVRTVNEEFRNYEVPPSRTENYANEIIQVFESRHRTASRRCTDVVVDSQNFYDEITVEAPREFEGFDTLPTAFRNGILHMQLDDVDKQLYWRLKK